MKTPGSVMNSTVKISRYRIHIFITTSLLLFIFSPGLHADAIFLKDGKIIEGKVTETGRGASVTPEGGLKQDIPARNIIRVIYTDNYKTPTYIHKHNGERIDYHIVGENRDFYIVRKDLASPVEENISKSEVDFITKKRLEDCPSINEGDYERYNETWDTWYMTFYTGYPLVYNSDWFPILLINSFEFSNSFSVPLYYSVSIGSMVLENESVPADEVETITYYIIFKGGYDYNFSSRIVLNLYAGAGAGTLQISDGGGGNRKNLTEYYFSTGIRLPIRFWGHDCIVPYLEYIYGINGNLTKNFIAGVGYAF